LDALYERVTSWPGVVVEFAPELSGKGPKIHFIVSEPTSLSPPEWIDARLLTIGKLNTQQPRVLAQLHSFPAIPFVQVVVIGRKGDTGNWIEQSN
jgi:hypothetical protein